MAIQLKKMIKESVIGKDLWLVGGSEYGQMDLYFVYASDEKEALSKARNLSDCGLKSFKSLIILKIDANKIKDETDLRDLLINNPLNVRRPVGHSNITPGSSGPV
jgi:hypothetical protein